MALTTSFETLSLCNYKLDSFVENVAKLQWGGQCPFNILATTFLSIFQKGLLLKKVGMDYTKLIGWKLKLLNNGNGDIKTQPKWVSEWPYYRDFVQ